MRRIGPNRRRLHLVAALAAALAALGATCDPPPGQPKPDVVREGPSQNDAMEDYQVDEEMRESDL